MTDQETPEIDGDDDEGVVIAPKRINGPDLAVLALGLAHNVCHALVLSLERALVVVGAHANWVSKEHEENEAVTKFLAELDELPSTTR